MFDPNADVSPVNPLPAVVVILALAVFGIECVLQLADRGMLGGAEGVGWRNEYLKEFAFFDSIFEYMQQTGTYDWNTLHRFVTYPFVTVSFMRALVGTVILLALGKMVAESFGSISVPILFFTSAILGALATGLFLGPTFPLVGSFPAVYGLLGAYTWMMWIDARTKGTSQLAAFRLVGFLFLLQLIYYFGFGAKADWLARLVGFANGFLLSFILAPDGRMRMRNWLIRIRQR